MSYPIPRIVHPFGTLVPTFPPVQKPYMDDLEAVRHDSITSSGLRQTMLERVDTIKNVQMENILWAEMPDWQAFFSYAIQGGPFLYYPDNTLTAYQQWELVDDKIHPQFNARGISKVSFKMRLVPGGQSSL